VTVRVASRILRVMGPDVTVHNAKIDRDIAEEEITRVVATIDWSAIEDEIDALLPEGYYVKVEE
jgi:hypothetical protein